MGPDGHHHDVCVVLSVESQKNVTEYKWKLKRAEQEITTLQGAVSIVSVSH